MYNEDSIVFSVNGAGKTGYLKAKKDEITLLYHTIHKKINVKWIKYFKESQNFLKAA